MLRANGRRDEGETHEDEQAPSLVR